MSEKDMAEEFEAVEDGGGEGTLFENVYDFVDRFITVMYPTTRSRERQTNWAQRWWAHPEAVVRLNALWKVFESLRAEKPATFMEPFLRVHADYHMSRLMAPGGVFEDCRREDTPSIPLVVVPVGGTMCDGREGNGDECE